MTYQMEVYAKFKGMDYDLIEFSHWKYDRTDKKMMFVDLQGAETLNKLANELTDRPILSFL